MTEIPFKITDDFGAPREFSITLDILKGQKDLDD